MYHPQLYLPIPAGAKPGARRQKGQTLAEWEAAEGGPVKESMVGMAAVKRALRRKQQRGEQDRCSRLLRHIPRVQIVASAKQCKPTPLSCTQQPLLCQRLRSHWCARHSVGAAKMNQQQAKAAAAAAFLALHSGADVVAQWQSTCAASFEHRSCPASRRKSHLHPQHQQQHQASGHSVIYCCQKACSELAAVHACAHHCD
jgi:hypothetical protein